jgi:unsaturated rhamnogalacturonyl hydrolase
VQTVAILNDFSRSLLKFRNLARLSFVAFLVTGTALSANAARRPAITNLGPTSGPVGTVVTITGTNFGSTQGSSRVAFNGKTAIVQTWSATIIVAPVPSGATTGSVVVTVGIQASNRVTFTVSAATPAPSITNLSPASGPVGTVVTIAGANFGTGQGSSVAFDGTPATATSWSASSITAPVPTGAGSGNVVVTVGGQASNGMNFTVSVAPSTPSITSLSPTSGPVGTVVTIAGANLGTASGSVTFDGVAATATTWAASSITVPVPTGAGSGNVVVTVGGQASNGMNFTVLPVALPSRSQVLSAIETVNNYWIASNPTPGNSDWTQATYFTGDLAAYDATGQSNYLSFAQSWASGHDYSLDGGNTTTYANYQAAGQVYIRLYQLNPNSSYISGITESVNGMVNSTVDNEWTWIDAINMSMPDFVDLGSMNNSTSYYTKMFALYSYTKYSLGLYDSVTGLWWENSTYAGTSTYWSRGNGWVFAAHAKVLSVLPTSDPHYAEYVSTFIGMAQALAARQQPGGYWNSDLGGTDYAGPESSGTSFFLYGLAWGLNNGILDQNTYLPVVENAWNFLANTAIQPSGLLGYVQPTGSAPGATTATTTEDFGVGAFLLAARQMALLTN